VLSFWSLKFARLLKHCPACQGLFKDRYGHDHYQDELELVPALSSSEPTNKELKVPLPHPLLLSVTNKSTVRRGVLTSCGSENAKKITKNDLSEMKNLKLKGQLMRL